MILQLIILVIFRQFIKKVFKKYDYHSLFRSLFCFLISASSILITCLYWDDFMQNPLLENGFSKLINTFMLDYMIIDLVYFAYSNNKRYELIFHHIVCAIIFYIFRQYFILTFCSICEILSAYNWVGIIFPNLDYISRLYKLLTIIFVRILIWFTTIFLFYKHSLFILVSFFVSIFIGLDIYWIKIIITNYLKYFGFIKNNMIDKKNIFVKNIKGKKNKLINSIKLKN